MFVEEDVRIESASSGVLANTFASTVLTRKYIDAFTELLRGIGFVVAYCGIRPLAHLRCVVSNYPPNAFHGNSLFLTPPALSQTQRPSLQPETQIPRHP